jgi:N-formylmaleamate deformylase
MFADLPQITCPTLLAHAGQSDVSLDDDAEEILSRLQSVSSIKIETVGHMMPFDDLELFIGAVAPFIR